MNKNGFTLIELLISIAISGFLMIYMYEEYQLYVAKSKTSAALEEISFGKINFDMAMNDDKILYGSEGRRIIGLESITNNCTSISVSGIDDRGYIRCVMSGNYLMRKHVVSWVKDDWNGTGDNTWRCFVSVDYSRYDYYWRIKPVHCYPQ